MDGSGQRPAPDEPPPKKPGPSPLGLLIAAVLVIGGGYYLSLKLRESGRLQDCVMSGRTNCAPVDANP